MEDWRARQIVQDINPRFVQETAILARARGQILIAALTRSTGTVRFYAVKEKGGYAKRGLTLYAGDRKAWLSIRTHARGDDAGLPKFWREALR